MLLPELSRDNFGILCSEASIDEVGGYKTAIENDKLMHKITFMTCAFFAGIDIEDKCHLITVSNMRKGYSILSLNKMTQIAGRCRSGTLSDTIIYNSSKKPLKYIHNYREKLEYKAQRVIDLLNASNNLIKNDKDLEDLFLRIENVIIEKADERFFYDSPIRLTRKSIDNKIEISYFNIDALCEQMTVYTKLYSDADSLYQSLLKKKHEINFSKDTYDVLEEDKDNSGVNKELVLNKIDACKTYVIDLKDNNTLNDDILNEKIRQSKRQEAIFYERIKFHYKFIDINFLATKLYDISLENKKSYRGVRNGLSFWVLDEKHPLKTQVLEGFKDQYKKYSSSEIALILQPIIKYHFFKTISQRRLVELFKVFFDWTYTQGKYLIKGVNPLDIPEPIKKISANEEILYNYFEMQ